MFGDLKGHARHRQLMAELRALEEREEGKVVAQVVSPPKEKLSVGKALMFLGGLSAVVYLFVFSEASPFKTLLGDEDDGGEKKPSREGEESRRIIDQIQYGKMEPEPAPVRRLPGQGETKR